MRTREGSGRLPAEMLRGKRLVVFDVDGTLYDQSRLRRAMAVRLLSHMAATGRMSTLRLLRAYRRTREATAEAGSTDFEVQALAAAARAGGTTLEGARETVAEWMHRRPLPLLRACRYPGVAGLVCDLRAGGAIIGVLSDYPAEAKLHALEIKADLVAHAGGPDIPAQKPDPAGLLHLMAVTGMRPSETILVGDRDDRDGEAARRAGVDVLLRVDKPAGAGTFAAFASLSPRTSVLRRA